MIFLIRQESKQERYQPNLTLCLWLFFSLKGLSSNQTSSSYTSTSARSSVSIAKVVNPLGTVTTMTESPRESILAADEFAEEYSSGAYIHENCDESMFRPYVAVISGTIDCESSTPQEKPESIGQKLIVPVIDSSQLEHQNRDKSRMIEMKRQQEENVAKFEKMSLLNRKGKNDSLEKSKKSYGKDSEKDVEKLQPKKSKEDKSSDKISSKKNDNGTNAEKKSNNGNNVTETVTVKLKKKGNKAQARSIDQQISETGKKVELSTKLDGEQLKFIVATPDKIVDCAKSEEFAVAKPSKLKNKSLAESSSSKEPSVEKDLVSTATTEITKWKKKNMKNDTRATPSSSSDDNKSVFASEIVFDNIDNSILLENIDKIDGAQCAEIQTSLLKTSVSATVSIRKGSMQEKVEDADTTDPKYLESRQTKKWSKESIEIEPVASNSATKDELAEFTYTDPSESFADLDNLSFKSTNDDQINLVPLESLQTDIEWVKERSTDYDRLSDDAETGSGAQYSDCKSFQLIIDEPGSYMRSSDTNSSSDAEDSSQSKSTKSSEKIVDEDDEELQPLICSTASDAAVDLSKSDTLPNESNQTESMTQPQSSEQHQQQPQKPSNSNNNNKKKFRKKRR